MPEAPLRLLADENVPRSAIVALREAGHDVRCVAEVSSGASDQVVLSLATSEDRILLTFDKDFGELATDPKAGGVPGVILFRFRLRSPETVAKHVLSALAQDIHWRGHLSVVEEHHVRSYPLG